MWAKLKKYLIRRNFSLLLVPEGIDSRVKTRKVSASKFFLLSIFFFIFGVCFCYLLFVFTPLKRFIPKESVFLDFNQERSVSELNEKVKQLLIEVEALKNTNDYLQNALFLGDSTLQDSMKLLQNPDSLGEEAPQADGNIFRAVQLFFSEGDNVPEGGDAVQQGVPLFKKPLDGFITKAFQPKRGHMGIDYAAQTGTPIVAAAQGYVISAEYTVNDGFVIILGHENNFITIYKHCDALLRKERDRVFQGETIALSGNTGRHTTGPHLHFEIWHNGEAVDPKTFLLNY